MKTTPSSTRTLGLLNQPVATNIFLQPSCDLIVACSGSDVDFLRYRNWLGPVGVSRSLAPGIGGLEFLSRGCTVATGPNRHDRDEETQN